mmetsp:Transcript_20662/g.37546  ORF Transcript_20662/g.37546 Transcript_20662/m.37546 type:complete len:275 (+) Transcript_20662:16-840(+)
MAMEHVEQQTKSTMPSKRHVPRSSFAQSFFQSATDDESRSDDGANFPVPRSRPRTRRSVSARARSNTADSMTSSVAAAAAIAAAEDFEIEDRNSWYEDALRQQGDADTLKEFLSDVADDSQFGDREVLEQYRIMAQCEARHRVKENIGFDIEEYEANHKLETEKTDKRTLFGGRNQKSKFRLPEPARPKPSATKLEPEKPPLLPPQPDLKLLRQNTKRVSGIQTGLISNSDDLPPSDRNVKCLGCRRNLQVNIMATLVRCPECNVVSPATSARR